MMLKDLFVDFENKSVFEKYGLCNLIYELYYRDSDILSVVEENMDSDVDIEDFKTILNDLKRYYYVNQNFDDNNFHFSEVKCTDKKYKGYFAPHLMVDTMRQNDFLNVNFKDTEITKGICCDYTKNCNPFSSTSNKSNLISIYSMFMTNITTDKVFIRGDGNVNYYLPDFDNYTDYFKYFIYITNNIDKNSMLINCAKDKKITPGYYWSNINDVKINDVVYDMKLFIHIQKSILDVADEDFKNKICNTSFYKYYGACNKIKYIKIDSKISKYFYNNYKNEFNKLSGYISEYKIKKPELLYETYYEYILCNSKDLENKLFNYNIMFNKEDLILNYMSSNLKLDNEMKDLVQKLVSNVQFCTFKVYEERYKSEKNMLNEKQFTIKNNIKIALENSTNLFSFLEYLTELSSQHKLKFINLTFNEIDKLDKCEYSEFKTYFKILLYSKNN